jgi:hypothetical protein
VGIVGLVAPSLTLSAVRMPTVKANKNAAAKMIMFLVCDGHHKFREYGEFPAAGALACQASQAVEFFGRSRVGMTLRAKRCVVSSPGPSRKTAGRGAIRSACGVQCDGLPRISSSSRRPCPMPMMPRPQPGFRSAPRAKPARTSAPAARRPWA